MFPAYSRSVGLVGPGLLNPLLCTAFPLVGGTFGTRPRPRLHAYVGTYPCHGTVCHSNNIEVDYSLNRLCVRFGFARILGFPSYPFLWIVLLTLDFCFALRGVCIAWRRFLLRIPFLGADIYLCRSLNLSNGTYIFVLSGLGVCSNYIRGIPDLLWLIYHPGFG